MPWTTPRDWTAGELVTEAIMDTHVRDNFNMTWHLIVRKTADESVTSSTVLQNDDHLFFAVGANEIWRVSATLIVDGSTAGDLQWVWTYPSGTLYQTVLQYENASDTAGSLFDIADATSPTTVHQMGTQTTARMFLIELLHVNAGSAGNLQLQWAQQASSGTATRVLANSALYGMKIA